MAHHGTLGVAFTGMSPLSVRILHRAGLITLFIMAAVLLGWWCYVSAVSLSAAAHYRTADNGTALVLPLTADIPKEESVPTAPVSQTTTSIEASTQQTNGQTSSQLKVNGTPVPVPTNGSVHKVIQDQNGTTTLDFSVNTNTSGAASTSSSTQTQVYTDTESSITSDSSP